MCAVYRVQREGEERAIKVLLDTGKRDRFVAEARILMSLDHPNVIEVQELVEGDPCFLVMDLLGGRDLEHHRDDGEKTSPEQAARWIADVASGLAAVHEAGLVHRDLKPSNLMLGSDGVVRLIDFGIAHDLRLDHRTAQNVLMGTATYLAPEMFITANPRALQDLPTADVFALGQTLCELLIGRAVHATSDEDGVSMARLMAEKLARESLDPREWLEVPQGLAAIVMRATAADPDERTPTAAVLESELRAWLADRAQSETAPVSQLETVSNLPTLPDAPVRGTRGRPWKKLGAAGAVVVAHAAVLAVTVAILAGLWVLRPRPDHGLARQIAADPRVPNCVRRPVRFEVRATTDGIELDGLSAEDAACIQVLNWHGTPGARAIVEIP